jgi:hypothetical protein
LVQWQYARVGVRDLEFGDSGKGQDLERQGRGVRFFSIPQDFVFFFLFLLPGFPGNDGISGK